MKTETCQLVDTVIAEMWRRPNDFKIGKYRLVDTATRHEYWIGNGIGFYGVTEPYEYNFGLYHGWRFGRALRRFKRLKSQTAMAKARDV